MEHTLFVHQDIALGQSMDLILNEISEENYWNDLLVWHLGKCQWYWHKLYTWCYCLPICNKISFIVLFGNYLKKIFYRNKYFVVIFLMVCIKLFVQLPKFSLFSIAFLRLFTFMTFSELFADAIQVWTRMTVKELPCVCILHNRKIQWYPKDIWKT